MTPILAERDRLSDRVLPGPQLRREGLVDNDGGAGGEFLIGEIAARAEWQAERREVARADRVVQDRLARRGRAIDPVGGNRFDAREAHRVGHAVGDRNRQAGRCRDALDKLSRQRLGARSVEAVQRRLHLRDDEVVARETVIHRVGVPEAADEKERGGQEERRAGNLRRDEQAPGARAAPFAAATNSHRDDEAPPCRLQCRQQPGKHTGDEHHDGGEEHQPQIHLHVQPLRYRRRQAEGFEQPAAPRRQCERSRAAQHREHQAFGHELPDDPPPAGAERRANANLALTFGRAREQERRDVEAGDEQHDADDPHRNPDERSKAANLRMSLAHLEVPEFPLGGILAVSRRWQLRTGRRQVGFCLRDLDAAPPSRPIVVSHRSPARRPRGTPRVAALSSGSHTSGANNPPGP